MKKQLLYILLFATAFLIALPMCNKVWQPYDEGWIVTSASIVSHGGMPYRDFFVMQGPGQFFVLAFFYSLFGHLIIIGRLWTVFVYAMTCLSIYLLWEELCPKKPNFILYAVPLFALIPRLGASPWPIWPAVALTLWSTVAFAKFIKKNSGVYLIIAGILSGLTFLFRYDFGIYIFLAQAVVLAIWLKTQLKGSARRSSFKTASAFIAYFLAVFSVICLSAIFFGYKAALKDLIFDLFVFPFKYHMSSFSLSFPGFCFNPLMLFYNGNYFVNINQFYFPIVIYILGLWFILAVVKELKIRLIALQVLLVGVFQFYNVMIRPDVMHLLSSIVPSYVLAAAVLFWLKKYAGRKNVYKTVYYILVIFLIVFTVKNMDKYIKNGYRKAFMGKMVQAEFKCGKIYIPREDADDTRSVVEYIQKHTLSSEKIYIATIPHGASEGNDSILYFLSERLPCTKYFMQHPGLLCVHDIRQDIIASIKKNAKLIVLAQSDVAIRDANRKSEICGSQIDECIEKNFSLVKKIGRYGVYLAK